MLLLNRYVLYTFDNCLWTSNTTGGQPIPVMKKISIANWEIKAPTGQSLELEIVRNQLVSTVVVYFEWEYCSLLKECRSYAM